MTRQASRTRSNLAGFTIVELLIVVVVIAILATITIVAYTGIKQRAVTSVISSAVSSWEKILIMDASTTNSLPINNTDTYCLGSSIADFPDTNEFNEGVCYKQDLWLESNPSDVTSGVYSYESGPFVDWPSDMERPSGALPVTSSSISIPSGGDVLRMETYARGIVIRKAKTPSTGTGVLFPTLGITLDPNVVYMEMSWVPQVEGECSTGSSSKTFWTGAGGVSPGPLSGDTCGMLLL